MKLVNTSRPYGEKTEDEVTTVKLKGVKVRVVARDFWVGPTDPSEEGYWQIGIFIDE